jgi:thiamine pyrophosphokinase
METLIKSHKSAILLNGSFFDPRMFSWFSKKTPLIAADGGANKLIQMGLCPTYIVGDGDSLSLPISPQTKRVILKSQEHTDFEKSILFAKEHSLFPSLVLGMNGKELDHILGNACLFMKYAENGNLLFLDSYLDEKTHVLRYKLGIPLTSQKLCLQIKPKSKVSLFPFGKTIVTSKGLRWELHKTALELEGLLSLRNEALFERVELKVHLGKLLVILDVELEALTF